MQEGGGEGASYTLFCCAQGERRKEKKARKERMKRRMEELPYSVGGHSGAVASVCVQISWCEMAEREEAEQAEEPWEVSSLPS